MAVHGCGNGEVAKKKDLVQKLPRELEKSVQKSGIAILAALGIKLYRRNVGGFLDDYGHWVQFADSGQSDTYGWIISTGTHVEIEWKRPPNKPTLCQLDWLKECTRTGAIAFWADNTKTAEKVARAVLAGGKIKWGDGDSYDVIFEET